jgi:preprotein translocase subunit SecE
MKKRTKKKKKRGTRKKTQAVSKGNVAREADVASTESVVIRQEAKPKPVQTIPRREPEKREEKKESVFRYINVVSQFLREARMELKKVKWPTRKELLASTAMVIFLVLVVSFFLGLIDFGLIKIIKNIVG